MRNIPEKQNMENAIVKTDDQIVKAIDLNAGDLITIKENGRVTFDGFAIVENVALIKQNDNYLYMVKVRMPKRSEKGQEVTKTGPEKKMDGQA